MLCAYAASINLGHIGIAVSTVKVEFSLTANVVEPSHHFQLSFILSYLVGSLSILMKQCVVGQRRFSSFPHKKKHALGGATPTGLILEGKRDLQTPLLENPEWLGKLILKLFVC